MSTHTIALHVLGLGKIVDAGLSAAADLETQWVTGVSISYAILTPAPDLGTAAAGEPRHDGSGDIGWHSDNNGRMISH